MEVRRHREVVMPVVRRGANEGLLPKPLLWLAGSVIVVLIGSLCVKSQGRTLSVRANRSQALPAALSPAAARLAVSGGAGGALAAGRLLPSPETGVVKRPPPDAAFGPSGRLIASAAPATTAKAHSLAQPPEMPSPTAGITVTGITGGRVRVAIVEMGGLSFVVGVGDHIRDFTVMAISPNEVVLRQNDRTFRLPLSGARTSQVAAVEGPPAVASPTAATPAAPAVTPSVGSPALREEPAAAPTLPQPPTATVTSVNLGPTAYPQQTTIPVWGVPLTPAPPNPQAVPPAVILYTPSGTSVYGFTSAPITAQSTVTQRGVTVLPVAPNEVQPTSQVLPPGATLYTPSGTSLYGITSAPITTQSAVTLLGATALPVAANQAQSVAQVLPWPIYRVDVGPLSDQQGAKEIAERLAKAGFRAKVDATTVGQYVVTLTPPPQATVANGLAILRSVGVDLPTKIEVVH